MSSQATKKKKYHKVRDAKKGTPAQQIFPILGCAREKVVVLLTTPRPGQAALPVGLSDLEGPLTQLCIVLTRQTKLQAELGGPVR